MKKELNIDNVVNFINLQDTFYLEQKQYKTTEVNNLLKGLLDYFYDDYESKDIEIPKYKITGTFIQLNNKIREKMLNNVSRIDFISLYPYVLLKLLKEGKLKINIEEFVPIYDFILTNRFIIQQHPLLREDGFRMLKYIINVTIGILLGAGYKFNKNLTSFLYVDNIKLVTKYTLNTFGKLMEDKDNIYYIDTDVIYLKSVTDEVIKEIDKLGVPYEIKNDIIVVFYKIKRYISLINGEISTKGLQDRLLKDRLLKDRFNDVIDTMKILSRNKKIKKLIKKVNKYVY